MGPSFGSVINPEGDEEEEEEELDEEVTDVHDAASKGKAYFHPLTSK